MSASRPAAEQGRQPGGPALLRGMRSRNQGHRQPRAQPARARGPQRYVHDGRPLGASLAASSALQSGNGLLKRADRLARSAFAATAPLRRRGEPTGQIDREHRCNRRAWLIPASPRVRASCGASETHGACRSGSSPPLRTARCPISGCWSAVTRRRRATSWTERSKPSPYAPRGVAPMGMARMQNWPSTRSQSQTQPPAVSMRAQQHCLARMGATATPTTPATRPK